MGPFWGLCHESRKAEDVAKYRRTRRRGGSIHRPGIDLTSITNVVPSSMMTTFHVFEDDQLLSRIRSSIQDFTSSDATTGSEVAMDKLLSKDLLQSVYAETLRLYTQSYITRCSAHECVPVGRWWLPRNEVCMVSSYVAHMNTELWNTQQGKHPVDSFWVERFILDPCDDTSGTLSPEYREATADIAAEKRGMSVVQEAHFSTKVLTGAWIPYGGGFSVCPGRLLAKRIISYTYALLVTEFDLEIRSRGFEMDSSAFGLGTQKPKTPVAFAIRRRRMQ